jgi:hypothetical protein
MRIGIARALLLASASLWLAGCSTSNKFSNLFDSKAPGADAYAATPANAVVDRQVRRA